MDIKILLKYSGVPWAKTIIVKLIFFNISFNSGNVKVYILKISSRTIQVNFKTPAL